MSPDPQNPYLSCVVRASAGSGKTYQLARRFLYLVGSGAHPASILTVTFTKKAAGEMRQRILDTAAQLLAVPTEQAAFDEKLRRFFRDTPHPLHRPRPPRSAIATAEAVLSSTQSLKIATIDAVLLEWMQKFPFEASHKGSLEIPAPFDLMNLEEQEQLHRQAWFETVRSIQEHPSLREAWVLLKGRGIDLLEVEARLRELGRHESFLWLLAQQRDTPSARLLPHPVPSEAWDDSPEGFLRSIAPELARVCGLLSGAKQTEAYQALEACDIEALIERRILTKKWEIHGNTFRKPKRDPVEAQIALINDRARQLRAYRSRQNLNEFGLFLIELYRLYEERQNQWKRNRGRLSFGDLIKGGYQLFRKPEAAGVRYLLHRTIRHLLLDEFQDTSILQWTMFSSMAHELLAGEGLRGQDEVPASLFIVGDAKQSIYGFREADAEVLHHAAQFMLSRQAADIRLSTSYRTAPRLLAYVNQVFHDKLPEFPTHEPAYAADGRPIVPGRASLTIGPLFREDDSTAPVAAEAQFVAETLLALLHDPDQAPIWDKETRSFRRLEARDCAVLYRAATHASLYAEALRGRGLAARMEEGHSFFERLEIRDLRALCRWMATPAHTEALCQCLKSPLFRIADHDLLAALQSCEGSSRYERHLRLVDHLQASYPDSIALLQKLLRDRVRLRPSQLLHDAIMQGAWTHAYQQTFGLEEGALAAANLSRFLETIVDLEAEGIYDWVPLGRRLDALAAEQAISLAAVSENAVQLMTIHKAKGLEFPLVILVGTGEEWEKSDLYWAKLKDGPRGSGIAYVGRKSDRTDDDPHFEELDELIYRDAHQENLRLLYVALTRAQHHLVITGHLRKKYAPGFYQHLASSATAWGAVPTTLGAYEVLRSIDPESEAGASLASSRPSPDAPRAEESLDWRPLPMQVPPLRILAPARLLNDSEEPTARSFAVHPYATEIGSFVHKGLEAYLNKQSFPAAEVWLALGPHHPSEIYREAYSYAAEKLAAVLASASFQGLLARAIQWEAELPIAFLSGDQLVRGTIDLLLQIGSEHWLVIDYKTTEEVVTQDDLFTFARKKRYDQQLALYVQGVQSLYPEAKVEGAIFFTASAQMLSLEAALGRASP